MHGEKVRCMARPSGVGEELSDRAFTIHTRAMHGYDINITCNYSGAYSIIQICLIVPNSYMVDHLSYIGRRVV